VVKSITGISFDSLHFQNQDTTFNSSHYLKHQVTTNPERSF